MELQYMYLLSFHQIVTHIIQHRNQQKSHTRVRGHIDIHLNSGLLESLQFEKNKRKRGKRLNLIGKERSGTFLFETTEVLKTKEFARNKKDIKV